MARVKRGVTTHARHKKIVDARRQCGFTRTPRAWSRSSSSRCDRTSRPAALYAHIARFRLAVAFGSS